MSEKQSSFVCPVCGSEMGIDYVGVEEHPVAVCPECDWPPPYPVSVEEWKARYEAEKSKPTRRISATN